MLLLGALLLPHGLHSQGHSQDGDNLLLSVAALTAGANKIQSKGGVLTRRGNALVGFGACADIWRFQGCPNILRGSEISPGNINWDDDINALVENLVDHHFVLFPAYQGLWQDRGSFDHKRECFDAYGTSEVYSLPYARSNSGTACDGRRKFDLSKFNQAYFDRYAELASAAKKVGLIVDIALYNQHRYLETSVHYQDQPWHPQNNVNAVSMPSSVPAANALYDRTQNRIFHRQYIRKMLDTLSSYKSSVILSLAEEYTGNTGFMNFFIDTVKQWEMDNNFTPGSIHISLAAPKNVLDAILATRAQDIFAINLRYFFYKGNVLFQPKGGDQVPGRYSIGRSRFGGAANSSAAKIHQKTLTYRQRYPKKIILDQIQGSVEQSWAFFMAKGSMLVQQGIGFSRRGVYGEPSQVGVSRAIAKVTDLVGSNFTSLQPADQLVSGSNNWCLAASNKAYIVFASNGGTFSLNLRNDKRAYTATWVNPRSGASIPAGLISGGGQHSFTSPTGSYTLVLK